MFTATVSPPRGKLPLPHYRRSCSHHHHHYYNHRHHRLLPARRVSTFELFRTDDHFDLFNLRVRATRPTRQSTTRIIPAGFLANGGGRLVGDSSSVRRSHTKHPSVEQSNRSEERKKEERNNRRGQEGRTETVAVNPFRPTQNGTCVSYRYRRI